LLIFLGTADIAEVVGHVPSMHHNHSI
jgi:hypothetical protein